MTPRRPKAGDPPDLAAPLDVLKHLLATEQRRLEVALAIEAERRIVFPETTVIIRDIERLLAEIERRENPDAMPAPAQGAPLGAPGELRPWGG